MAVPMSRPRRTSQTPGRQRDRSATARDSEPPRKRRKHITSTIGSGGHFTEHEDRDELTVDAEDAHFPSDDLTITVRGTQTEHNSSRATPPPNDEVAVSPRTVRARTASRPRRDRDRARTRGRAAVVPRPRYSSAAAAAAASQASDGYKPREERSWEEFHPDLDIEAELTVFTADEVDGRARSEPKSSLLRHNTSITNEDDVDSPILEEQTSELSVNGYPAQVRSEPSLVTPRRKPGRPPRRPESMLSGLGSPPAPRIVPLPTHNPKERLNLPKPSYRPVQTFEHYEQDKEVQVNYVDKSMAHVGYQENDRFDIPQDAYIRYSQGLDDDNVGHGLVLESDEKSENTAPPQVGNVEYDMDEQDEKWLEIINAQRREEQVELIKPAIFEITVTQLEREQYALEMSKFFLCHSNE